jgi:integrase
MKGHLEERGKDRWYIVLELGRDADGKRRRRRVTFDGKKTAAEKELVRLLRQLDTGTYLEPDRVTVAEYLRQWLADYAKPKVAPRTYERYEEIVRLHLAPELGHLKLAKLRPAQISAFYAKELEKGNKQTKGALSAQTVLHHHRVLKEALRQAVKWQLLYHNPAEAVEPPRPEKREMKTLTAEETKELFKTSEGSALHGPIVLAATTGMRAGEVLGLHWRELDLHEGRLYVTQALQATRSQGLVFRQPKTAKSKRPVKLLPLTVAILKAHGKEQAAERLRAGKEWKDQDLVFPTENGLPWHPSHFHNAWRKFARDNGIQVRFHDLRHTHATLLLCEGIHPKVVSERLGHSTVGITLDTYSHVLPDLQDEAVSRLQLSLGEVAEVAARQV